MQVSARVLGQNYGLTAEEMNRVLVKQGIYQGTPCNYSPTQEGVKYVAQRHHHRGTGGYSWYNRDWTTTTIDDSIKDVLNVTDELISEVRGEIAAERAARYAAQAAARAQADADFLAKQEAERAAKAAAERAALEAEEFAAKWKKGGMIVLAIGGAVILGYGIYKLTPKVKQWWKNRKQPNEPN